MAISGQENINIGLPNETQNSDSLYAAFNKTQNNFTTLFSTASPYNTFSGGDGISTTTDPVANLVTITNTGVTYINAGTGVTLSGNTGNITISAMSTDISNGTVTSVGIVGASGNARIVPSGTNPVVASGTIVLDLATTGVVAGTYAYPTLTVDDFGRINNISNGNSVGTVTSVGVLAGPGIIVTGSPVTSNGEMTVINDGVIRINAGSGIALSDNTGNVTISVSQNMGTVTSVEVVSSTLNVSGSPIVNTGSIIIDMPGNLALPGTENLPSGNAVNLSVVASYFTTTGASTATLADGVTGQIKTFMMVADGGDMVITVSNAAWGGSGTMTFGDVGDGCTLQYVTGKWFCVGNNGVTFG